MGGDNSTTTTSSSGMNNKELDKALSTIGTQLNTQLGAGVNGYAGSMVPDMSSQTTQGVNALMGAAGNTGGLNAANGWTTGTIGSGGYNSALTSAQKGYQGQIASGGYNSALTNAQEGYQNQITSGGYNPALTKAQSGINNYLAESQAGAPGYAALRSKAGDDTLRDVNSIFTTSGRFGSGSHVNNATESLGNVYAAMDMQNYQDRLARQLSGNQALAGIGQTAMGNLSDATAGLAGTGQTAMGNLSNATAGVAGIGQTAMGNAAGAASMAPGLLQAGMLPAQAMLQAGSMMDAYNAAKAAEAARQYDVKNNAGWGTLERAGGILGTTSGAAGTTGTTTQTQNVPWWQAPVQIGGTLLGAMF